MISNKNKILIVVQRYGADVVGGSESLARAWAHCLAKKYSVTIATTCARDDTSWANVYSPGQSREGDVSVKRFWVDKERDFQAFSQYSADILGRPHHQPASIQEEWMIKQGPSSTTLFEFLKEKSQDYHLVIFVTYLYATTVLGLRQIPLSVPVVLIPTAHDEPPIYLSIFREVFMRPNLLLFNTEAERKFCRQLFPALNEKPMVIVGCGVDVLEEKDISQKSFQEPYFVYAGRIAHGKGMAKLFEYCQRLPESLQAPLHLMGKVQMDCPKHQKLKYLGFVSEEDRTKQIRNASAMIVPSPYESLSLSTLESWAVKTPVIVNGWSEVLADHVRKSEGGLIYRDWAEFRFCIEYALGHPDVMTQLGNQGYQYVRKNYSWPVIEGKLYKIISSLLSLQGIPLTTTLPS